MILENKLELKLEIVGVELRADLCGTYYHVVNRSDQKLIWKDGNPDIQEFYVFPVASNEDDEEYAYYEHFMDDPYDQIPMYSCKQIDCLYENVYEFSVAMKELVIAFCKEHKIPDKFIDHYYDGHSVYLKCAEDFSFYYKTKGICNEDDKYKKFKWECDIKNGTVKIYDNIIVPDLEEKVETTTEVIKFFNKFADIWNNEIIGKYER